MHSRPASAWWPARASRQRIEPALTRGKILPKSPPASAPIVLLVERGLFESRARARAAIEAGGVDRRRQAGRKGVLETIAADAEVSARPAHPWPSRGGVLKLSGALERYPIDIEDHVCLDVGASTGGFTDVLLANGASLAFSIDVGHGQLHPSLQNHPKIVSMEETDIRASSRASACPARPDIVVIDVSFYFAEGGAAGGAVAGGGADPLSCALIKPQFEAERKHSKHGALSATRWCISKFATTSRPSRLRSAARISRCFRRSIAGGDGNIEFFLSARRG